MLFIDNIEIALITLKQNIEVTFVINKQNKK